MPYIPHTDEDRREMLAKIGVGALEELFREIPENLRLRRPLDVPPGMDEPSLLRHMRALSDRNTDLARTVCFLGAGIYDRYVPASVGAVISRGEFLTAYTPYQPELSQGYLQTIYEFQSLVAELLGCDLANASMYDGATSLAEAVVMCCLHKGSGAAALSPRLHPHYRDVVRTYCWAAGLETVDLAEDGGLTSTAALPEGAACVAVQSPNFFGAVEDVAAFRSLADAAGAMLVVSTDPVACGLLQPPGALGADVVTAEGQGLGLPMGFGGPLLGLFACKQGLVRQIPGRIVGRTRDAEGTPGYTMTLRTREQDIRRERATSNICTNEALMALASTVTMCALGKTGIRKMAEATVRNSQYAARKLTEAGGRLRFEAPVFGEFVLSLPVPAEGVVDALLERKILAGLPLGPYFPGMENDLLVAVTEMRTRAEIDAFAEALGAAVR
jgi:glycine dehydrogenase subunit 1